VFVRIQRSSLPFWEEKRASEYEEELRKKGDWAKGRGEDVRKKVEL